MILMRTFFSKCTPQALEYLDQHVQDWVLKEHAKILFANQSFGVIEGKGGQKDPNLFLNIYYEKEAQ